MKSDESTRNICIAAINRHTLAPFDFLFTNRESIIQLHITTERAMAEEQ
jgi:hypothetical protein